MKKMVSLALTVLLICGTSAPASAVYSAMTAGTQTQSQAQDRTQEKSCKQTEICTADREQARLQIKDRLQICDQAKIQYQQQDQTRSSFGDTDQHWANDQIRTAYSWGLINGYPDGNFQPNNTVSGTEAVLMMSRLMNCLNTEDASEVQESDIDWQLVPVWAKEQMQEEVALRIAAQSQCYGEGQLNRLQFAIMLAKAIGIEPTEVPADTTVFLDQADISAEDLGYIAELRILGILQGSNGCFCADQAVTRAEAAAMLTRILEILQSDTL
ncbi:MAG: S-layer homology domain-containing protein [Clostridiaceae bacterium]|nr:S-layer homology domain-containing protein [Clostridiaceae bacterium]